MNKAEILAGIGVFILMGTLGGVETGRLDLLGAVLMSIIGFSLIGYAASEDLL